MMQSPIEINLPSPLEELQLPFIKQNKLRLFIKRDELIHDEVSGNKWRKLKYNLLEAQRKGYTKLLTFGGAYSNHLAATALAAKLHNLNLTCFVRGEERSPLNVTLQKAQDYGTSLVYMDRSTYQLRNEEEFLNKIKLDYPEHFIIPEGGTNHFAIQGITELIDEVEQPIDFWCCPVGSAGTISGLINGLKGENKVIGFPAIKGGEYLKEVIENLLPTKHSNWDLIHDYHFGGFGKIKGNQISFKDLFEERFNIELDPIYTSKMLFGIFDLIEKGFFKAGSTILALHTGGLQGNLGMIHKMESHRNKNNTTCKWF